jgi:hypothetical protein
VKDHLDPLESLHQQGVIINVALVQIEVTGDLFEILAKACRKIVDDLYLSALPDQPIRKV